MNTTTNRNIFVVGPARSGTTYVAQLLGLSPAVAIAIEPHVLWRSGNMSILHDELPVPDMASRAFIAGRLAEIARGKTLVEKSPPNSLRPDVLYELFPDSRIVYLRRRPEDVISSNLRHDAAGEAMRPKLLLQKYLRTAGSRVPANTDSHLSAWGTMPLSAQLHPRDYAGFARLIARYAFLKRRGLLPFGPRIHGFHEIIARRGRVEYYREVLNRTEEYRMRFMALYEANLIEVEFEQLAKNSALSMQLFDQLELEPPVECRLRAFMGGRYKSPTN